MDAEVALFKAQYLNKAKLKEYLWSKVKNIPGRNNTISEKRLLNVWKNFYWNFLYFAMSKTKEGEYLYGLAFPETVTK